MRINKFLTTAGYCSRREADKLTAEGRVKINVRKAELGDQVSKTDKVFVDDKEISLGGEKVYLAYNKPVGVITTTDKKAKDNIISKINYPVRVYPIGRLDVKTSGLILLTNDGSVVNKILKGQAKIEKEYEVTVEEKVDPRFLKRLEQGIVLDGFKTLPAKTKKVSDHKFRMTIVEGKNRQIRRMVKSLGNEVLKLKRVRIGSLNLEGLEPNKYVELSERQIQKMIKEKTG